MLIHMIYLPYLNTATTMMGTTLANARMNASVIADGGYTLDSAFAWNTRILNVISQK